MAEASASEIASVIAATVSAIGGAFAAFAAFRSAAFAKEANQSVARAECRLATRELVVVANEVLIELQRVESRGHDLKRANGDLAMFCGQFGGSRQEAFDKAADEKVSAANAASAEAREFVRDTTAHYDASLDDINKRLAKMQQSLFVVRTIREDLDRECVSVESQIAVHREQALQRSP